MKIELYIDNKLCDLGDSNLNLTLKRQFLNPKQLYTKDASKSYDITIPATATNNEIFSYVNVEEVENKFRMPPRARLYVGGVLLLDGVFAPTQISREGYKGNLGVPRRKEIKDVFGDTMLNRSGTWKIDDFRGFESISEYNTKSNSPMIFPLALYGLLPKSPKPNGEYTDKEIFDNSVTLDIDDFRPSINCIEMLKKIFSSSGYNLSGTALTDDRLANLYMSYKNPNEYEFNWGIKKIGISGEWIHYNTDTEVLENKYQIKSDTTQYTVNVFDAINHKYNIKENDGQDINVTKNKVNIVVPYTGLYKVRLSGYVAMQSVDLTTFPNLGLIGVKSGSFEDAPIEIHLVKNLDKELSEVNFNNKFAFDNMPQNGNEDTALFPQPSKVNFIDPKQDKNFVCGFSFGRHPKEEYRNPLNPSSCNPMAISGGRSWNFSDGEGVKDRTFSAVESPMYRTRQNYISNKYIVELNNAEGKTETSRLDNFASGDVYQVVWLEKGDRLDLLTSTMYHWDWGQDVIYGYNMLYDLELEPFQHNINWLKIDTEGNSITSMNWNDESSFVENQIDLIKSLPSEIKVNDWIDDFCKAFNLVMYRTGLYSFGIDLNEKSIVKNTSIILNLDEKANVHQSSNEPLNVPYLYELGFTVDTNEEGYYKSIKEFNEHGEPILTSGDNGGGIFETGSQESSKLTQTSNFSYCWYKELYRNEEDKQNGVPYIKVPIITDREIWTHDYDTKEMLSKQYFDKGLRFWYKSGTKELDLGRGRTATVAIVSNEHKGDHNLSLDYKRENPNSIMNNYFMLLTNQKYYTIVKCYLTPQEYSNLDISLVRFNGDLYNIAEIDGYDPLGRSMCTLKLIRKI